MIFFLKADGTLIKSAPDTVYQGSAEAGKIYVVAPLNAGMLVDVYYELPNGERWGAYLLENNGKVINNEELPDGWALWSTTLDSAITQYAGTLKAQFGFYQSGTADKVPLITSQAVTITIAKGVVRDLPSAPPDAAYSLIVNAISSIKQDIANLPNEYLYNTNEDKIALKNNSAIEYSENATAGTIVKRDSNGKINVSDGTEDLNAVNVRQFNAALAGKVDASSVSSSAVKDTIAQRTSTGQLKAVDGVADDDLATVKQLNAVQVNYTDITNIDLNTGNTTVEYDTELGITVNAKGTVTHKNGNAEQPTTKFEVPIVSGDGIVIDKAQNEEKISVKVDGKVTKTPNSIVKRDSAGRVKTADAVSDEDAASYGQQKALRNYTDSELLKKLDRTGGTITGNLIVSGNLSVSGETSVIESTTLKVEDKLIYVAKDNTSALTSPAGLITPKYDGTNDGGLVYDNSGTAYVGDIKLDSNGNVDVNTSDLQPIATRDVYSNFTNGHKVKAEVDISQKSVKFVDGGKDDGINSLTNVNLTVGNTTVQYDTTNGIQLNSTARFTDGAGNHDATMDLDLPIVGKDGIVIGKAADSEKIEVSGKNFVKSLETEVGQWKIYASKNGNPNDFFWTGTEVLDDLCIVVRGNNGCIYTNMPNAANTKDTTVPNKKYVEDNFTPAYSSTLPVLWGGQIICYNNNKYGRCSLGTGTDEYTAVLRDTGGQINLPDIPAKDSNAISKKYADANYAKSLETEVGQWKIYASKNGNPNSFFWTGTEVISDQAVVVRGNNGCIYTNMPDAGFMKDTTVPNKKYVDDAIASISSTTQTKYQHNLVLEGTKLGSTIKAFMSIPRSDNTAFGTLDELVSALGDAYISCTGYIYDGNQKSYVIVAFNTAGPGFEYNDPETGGQVFTIGNDDVAITDNVLEF